MSYIFKDATLLTFNLNRNYSNEGDIFVNQTKNLTLNGILYQRGKNLDFEGVKESYSGINEILSLNTGQYEAIIINNIDFGTGRILNVSFPKDNPVILGAYVYDIEIIESGNFNVIPINNIYGSGISSIKDKLLNLAETLNFNNSSDGKYSYDHTLDIQYYNDNSDIIQKSKILAESIFNDQLNINLGLFGKFSGFYNNLRARQNVIQENYDLINKSVSFTKSIQIDEIYQNNYSLELTTSSSLNQDGIFTITENGKIFDLENTDNYILPKQYAQNEINNSFTRCNQISLAYNSTSINQTPITLGLTVDKFNRTINYNITYADDPKYYNNVLHSYEEEFDLENNGILSYTRNGEVGLSTSGLGEIIDINFFKNIYTGALAVNTNLKLVSTNVDYNLASGQSVNLTFGKRFNYTIRRTNDRFIMETGDKNFKTMEINRNFDYLEDMTKEYIIANKEDENFYFSKGLGVEQVQLANDSVSLNGTLLRPTGRFIWSSNFINDYIPAMRSGVLDNVRNIGSDYIITDCNLSYGSDLSYKLELNIQSVKPK